LFTQLCAEPSLDLSELREALRAHLEKITSAVAENEFLDLRLARAIAASVEALLDEAATRDEHARRLVQAAVRYFLLDDDAEHDLESVCGLDDDAAVCNAVASALGREELRVLL